jgi:hypothetical protein
MHLKQCPQLDGVYKKSITFQIQIYDNYKWFDCSQLLWVNDTRRKHVLFYIKSQKDQTRSTSLHTGCPQKRKLLKSPIANNNLIVRIWMP